jgi:toxin ParE1/3/4
LRIIWTERALIHIDAIGAYLDERNSAARVRILGAIGKGVERLALHPFSGRVGRAPRTRELVVPRTPYVVAYRVRGENVEILAVIHGAQRWPKRL